MTIDLSLTLFALNNTTDPAFAARLCDSLGNEIAYSYVQGLSPEPKVSLPPHWVLSKLRAPVDVICFAVKYCDDVVTLDTVAHKDKRINTYYALVNNSALSQDTFNYLLTKVPVNHQRAFSEIVNLRNAPSPIDDIEELLNDNNTYFNFSKPNYGGSVIDELANMVDHVSGIADRFLSSAAKLSVYGPALMYLYEYYGLRSSRPELWNTVTDPPHVIVSSFNKRAREGLLLEFVDGLLGSTHQQVPVEARFTKLLIDSVDPKGIKFSTSQPSNHFTKESVDLFVTEPTWLAILSHQTISDAQFKKLLSVANPSWYIELFALLEGKRSRLSLLLKEIKSSFTTTSQFNLGVRQISVALGCLSSTKDLLIKVITGLMDIDATKSYLNLDFSVRDANKVQHYVVPPIKDVRRLVAILTQAGLTNYIDVYRVRSRAFSIDYSKELVEYVPGLSLRMTLDVKMGPYIYDRLLSSGAAPEVAIDQLGRSENTSLSELHKILSAIAKISK